jgi:hypothetical protein
MALFTKDRGRTLTLACGASLVVLALWDVSDQSFGSSEPRGGPIGLLIDHLSVWLFDTFGHRGPRVALVGIGIAFVAASFWLASPAREIRGPWDTKFSDPRTGEHAGGTRKSAILSWTLVLLVLSLLAFVVVGPLLGNPTIDRVLSYWHESYYPALTSFLALIVVIGLSLRWNWEEFRETGDPWSLLRPAFYSMAVIIVVIFLSWKAIFGT